MLRIPKILRWCHLMTIHYDVNFAEVLTRSPSLVAKPAQVESCLTTAPFDALNMQFSERLQMRVSVLQPHVSWSQAFWVRHHTHTHSHTCKICVQNDFKKTSQNLRNEYFNPVHLPSEPLSGNQSGSLKVMVLWQCARFATVRVKPASQARKAKALINSKDFQNSRQQSF